VLAFILTATIALSPNDKEIRAEQELMRRIEETSLAAPPMVVPAPVIQSRPQPGTAASRARHGRRQAQSGEPLSPQLRPRILTQ
jgi:hypothetical protein